MLNYEEFKDKIVSDILSYLPEKYDGSEVKIVHAVKTNDHVLDGVMIRRSNCNIAPNIYLNAFYEEYREGSTIDSILTKIAEIRMSHDVNGTVDAEKFMSYENIKDHIYISVINYECNRKLLEDRPHRRFLDLAITYYVHISECSFMDNVSDGRLVMNMTHDLMEEYSLTEEELYEIAKRNTGKRKNIRLTPLEEELKKRGSGILVDDPFGKVALILTNPDSMRGAALIVCENVLRDLSKRFDSGIFVFPLSVDEVIIVPEYEISLGNIMNMDPDEFGPFSDHDESYLSNRVYYYTEDIGKLSIVNSSKEIKV